MKALVVYTSRTGNTRRIAEAIAQALNCEIYPAADAPDPGDYDFIALGFGVYRGWPDGDFRAYLKRCRRKAVGVFMTLGAYADSPHAHNSIGRAEGLLEHCLVKARFICQGGYSAEMLERLKQRAADSLHGWDEERARRVRSAMEHPNAEDEQQAATIFREAWEKLQQIPPLEPKPEKKAIVLAAFGSTVEKAAAAYEEIERQLRERYPELPVIRAYTSFRVRRKLNNEVPSLPGVLHRLVLDGYNMVTVVAAYLTPGEEYHKVKRDVSAFSGLMEIKVTRPPLSAPVPMRKFLRATLDGLPAEREPGDAVLFMGHGHADGRSDFIYQATAAELAKLDPNFLLACVEGENTLEQAMSRLRAHRVWLVPLMLVAGDHALNDLAGDEPDSWRSRLTAAGYEVRSVLRGLGENPAVAAWFTEEI